MITCESLTYAYPNQPQPVLRDLTLSIPDGAFVLVTGASGAGKSTLLRALNGLVPHFHGGQFGGHVRVDGQSTLDTPPRQIARAVGFVFQDPEAQFVVGQVEDEIAFSLENAGITPDGMERRIDHVLRLLGIAHLRGRQVSTLSGGEAQRVAIASALALEPRHLALDEPTSQLDPLAARELLDALVGLNRRLGLTVILAEHRLERIVRAATHLLYMEANGEARLGPVRDLIGAVPLRPPVVEAALRLGWQPVPLDLDEARRGHFRVDLPPVRRADWSPPGVDLALEARDLSAGYGGRTALHGVNWAAARGEIVGLVGANGAGKSTLLKALVGLVAPSSGEVRILGAPVAGQKRHDLARRVGYVPQDPNSILFANTLREELQFTLRNHGLPGDGAALLAELEMSPHAERYPRDLSGGERQRAALAAMLTAEPPVILLDEPTRGLDYLQKRRLAGLLRRWATAGRTVVVATHDVEWLAGLAGRVTLLQAGRITADGPTGQVLLGAPGFATQIGELFGHPDYLTAESLTPDRRAPGA
ncbi:MAG: ABC transporter ATP-binding protein [Anaerolineae bacterium]|nr:ABC transporter ATP-binding protein [Anaerolineae bacterium]